jgi:hypothetical protein
MLSRRRRTNLPTAPPRQPDAVVVKMAGTGRCQRRHPTHGLRAAQGRQCAAYVALERVRFASHDRLSASVYGQSEEFGSSWRESEFTPWGGVLLRVRARKRSGMGGRRSDHVLKRSRWARMRAFPRTTTLVSFDVVAAPCRHALGFFDPPKAYKKDELTP